MYTVYTRRLLRNLFFAALLLAGAVSPVSAALTHDQAFTWNTLVSKHFELHYHDGEDHLAIKALNIAEKKFTYLTKLFNWQPKDSIEIILTDEIDVPNGFVSPLLYRLRITLYLTAPDELWSYDDWLDLLITHELTHAIHLDKAQHYSEKLKSVFGRNPLLFPNLFQPLWLIEGLATYMETDVEQRIGRGHSAYFNMLMRMEVKRGLKPLDQVNLDIRTWPIGVTRYLYGYYFYKYLEKQYGRENIISFVENYSSNLIPFKYNENSRRTFGKTFPDLWQSFIESLNGEFKEQISAVNEYSIVEGEALTDDGYMKLYASLTPDGNLLYARYDGESRPALLLKKLELDKTEFVAELETDARLDYHPDSGIIVSQLETYRNTNQLYDLYHVDLSNKTLSRLTRGDRYRRAAWNPDGDKIAAIYNKLGKHTLVLLKADGRLVDLLYEGNEDEVIGDLDWSPDGRYIVASVKRKNTGWNLELFNIAQRAWESLTSDDYIQMHPRFTTDGQAVLFSADYNGIFNLQQMDLQSRNIAQLTNVEGGAFRPQAQENGSIIYLSYSPQGYDVYQLASSAEIQYKPNTMGTRAKKSDTSNADSKLAFEQQSYSASSRLSPAWWMPILGGDNDSSYVGLYTAGSDALNIHSYDLKLLFDFDASALSGQLNYAYDRWFPLLQLHVNTQNRVKRSEEGYQLELLFPLLSRKNRWYYGLTYLHDSETDKTAPKDIKTTETLIGTGGIFDSRRQNNLSNSVSDGRLVSLTFETSELFGSDFNGKMLIGKWREYIRTKGENVIALRIIGGLGLESPRPFQLGGFVSDQDFNNNLFISSLPPRASLYNKRRYALRGYPDDAESLVGRRIAIYNVEWRFPIKRYERGFRTFPLGLHQFSGTLFGESGAAWSSGVKPGGFHYSAGTELHAHTEWFFFLPVRLRFGYAYGFNDDGEHQVYLAFNTSF